MSRKTYPTPLSWTAVWAVAALLAGAGVVAACATPAYFTDDIPAAAAGIHKALRSGYENARRSADAEHQPLADMRGNAV